MLNPTHHYCDVYDSLQQVKNVKWGGSGNRYYLGRLRLDTLLARKTIIKDAELLNGIFFLSATESEDFFNDIPLANIQIRSRSRSANLEEALVELFAHPGEENLRGIILQALPRDEAYEARKRLKTIPSTRVTDHQSLCRVLRDDAGIDPTWVDKLEQAWRKWIDLSTSGKLNIVTWNEFNFGKALTDQLDGTKQATFESLDTELGKDLLEQVYGARSNRGVVVEQIRGAEQEASETEWKDIATVSSWHSAAYNRSVAVHHDCGMVEITDDPNSRPIGWFRQRFDEIFERLPDGTESNVTANISPAFLVALSKYSKKEYDDLMEKHKRNLDAWHNEAEAEFPAQAVNELVEEVDRVEPYKDDRIIPEWYANPLKVFFRTAADIAGPLLLGIIVYNKARYVIHDVIDRSVDKIVPPKHAHVSRRIVQRATSLARRKY